MTNKKLYKKEYILEYLKINNLTSEQFCQKYSISITIFKSVLDFNNIYIKKFLKIYDIIGKPKDFFDEWLFFLQLEYLLFKYFSIIWQYYFALIN